MNQMISEDIISDMQNGNLVIISDGSTMEKTSFLLSIVKDMAVDKNISVGMFSLVRSNLQLVNLLLQIVCEISAEKIKSGKFTKEEWSKLTAHTDRLRGAPIYVDDTPPLTVDDICSKARNLVKNHGVKVILIDCLQMMSVEGSRDNSETSSESFILCSFKDLAKELDIPVIITSLAA